MKIPRRPRFRRQKGAIAVQFAATLAFFVPVVILVAFSCYEVATAFLIYSALNHCAQQAAMALSKAYASDANYATSTSMQQSIFQQVTYANMVVSPQQFTAKFPSSPGTASWSSTTGNVPAVVVTCTYAGGQYGLPPFPNPDPLKLGSNFSLKAVATAYLE